MVITARDGLATQAQSVCADDTEQKPGSVDTHQCRFKQSERSYLEASLRDVIGRR